MTNEEAKQEAIKKAWGVLYQMLDKIMIEEQHQRGGNWYANWRNTGQFYRNFLVDFVHFAVRDDLQNLNGYWWPKSITDVIYNNGWTRIEPDGSNLPTKQGWYKTIDVDGYEEKMIWYNNGITEKIWIELKKQHYKLIIPEEGPVY